MSEYERRFHRKVAAECFNRAWDLLDRKDKGPKEDEEMLNAAHASRYHWGLIGEAKNRAIGDWQISRVYADLGQGQLSLTFAKSCLKTCEENGLSHVLHTADEAMARAHAVSGEYIKARRWLKEARRRLGELTLGKEEREVYLGQIDETEALLRGR